MSDAPVVAFEGTRTTIPSGKESTKAVKNTIEVYSKYTLDYPYPVAISVHTASNGMEYPMICFNFGRTE